MPKQVAPRPPKILWDGLKPRVRQLRHDATPAEQTLWAAVRANRLGFKFRRQHPIGTYVVDFFCPAAGLAIELDGSVHLNQLEADENRQAYMEANHIRVLRFKNDEIEKDLPNVLTHILTALNSGST